MVVGDGGERLRRRREAAGLSQEHLARLLGCSVNTVGRAERGRTVPTLPMAQRIAAALGCTVEDLWVTETAQPSAADL